MDWRQVVQEGAVGLLSHRLRAGLAILGIAIGVGSVVAMVALGEGARVRFSREFEKLGANLVLVSPEAVDREGLGEGDGRVRSLTVEDGRRILEASAHLAAWSADLRDSSAQASHAGRSSDIEIHGVPPSFAPLRNFSVASGRLIEKIDLETFAPVCVLGSEVAGEIFGAGEDPVGQELVLDTLDQSVAAGSRGMRCRVVGVLAPKGQALWMNFDRYVLMPITTAQRRFRGDDAVDQLMFQVKDAHSPDRAAFEIDTLMRRRHRNTPDFKVRLQSEFRESMEQTLKVFQYFLGGIAGISLLVGGIGIANIMLIAVLERTREIGVRMALGAKRRHILGQFLTEAVAIGGLGGLCGLLLGPLLGVGVARILSAAFEQPWVSKFAPSSAVFAFLFSLLVGVAAGLYPALRASRLHPVEALRYE